MGWQSGFPLSVNANVVFLWFQMAEDILNIFKRFIILLEIIRNHFYLIYFCTVPLNFSDFS